MGKRTTVTPSESKPANDTKTETNAGVSTEDMIRGTLDDAAKNEAAQPSAVEKGEELHRQMSEAFKADTTIQTMVEKDFMTDAQKPPTLPPLDPETRADVEAALAADAAADRNKGIIAKADANLAALADRLAAGAKEAEDAALAKDAEADANKGLFDFDGDLEETTVNDARSVADWKPTHRVRSEQSGDVSVFGIMFVLYEHEEGGAAFTLEEWRTGALADFTRNAKGEWLFLEQPFAGSVAAINRDFVLHLAASEPGAGGVHLYPDSSAHDLGEYETKEEAIAIGRAYLSEHPEAWLQVRGLGAVDNIVKE